MSSGVQIERKKVFSSSRNRFFGWGGSAVVHCSILYLVFSQLSGQFSALPSTEYSNYRTVGISLLPSEPIEQINENENSSESPVEEKEITIPEEAPVVPEVSQIEIPPEEESEVVETVEIPIEPVEQVKAETEEEPSETDLKPETELLITESTAENDQQETQPVEENAEKNFTGEGHQPGSLEKDETIFFGLKDKGKRFVYLIDVSDSMEGVAIARVKNEVIASLRHLQPDQQFQVFFFNRDITPLKLRSRKMKGMYPADQRNLAMASEMIKSVHTRGGTLYFPVFPIALGLEPDVVFLLTDAGEPHMNGGEMLQVKVFNKSHARIHAIEFGKTPQTKTLYNFLTDLASDNNGKYKYYHVKK